jgi:hypothetical protein
VVVVIVTPVGGWYNPGHQEFAPASIPGASPERSVAANDGGWYDPGHGDPAPSPGYPRPSASPWRVAAPTSGNWFDLGHQDPAPSPGYPAPSSMQPKADPAPGGDPVDSVHTSLVVAPPPRSSPNNDAARTGAGSTDTLAVEPAGHAAATLARTTATSVIVITPSIDKGVPTTVQAAGAQAALASQPGGDPAGDLPGLAGVAGAHGPVAAGALVGDADVVASVSGGTVTAPAGGAIAGVIAPGFARSNPVAALEAGRSVDAPSGGLSPSRAAELIASFSPFDQEALEQAIDHFLARLDDLDVELSRLGESTSLIPNVVAAAVVLSVAETVRRKLRGAGGEGRGSAEDDEGVGFPGLPGRPERWALEEL